MLFMSARSVAPGQRRAGKLTSGKIGVKPFRSATVGSFGLGWPSYSDAEPTNQGDDSSALMLLTGVLPRIGESRIGLNLPTLPGGGNPKLALMQITVMGLAQESELIEVR